MDTNIILVKLVQRMDIEDLFNLYKVLLFSGSYNLLESKEILTKLSVIHKIPYKNTFKEFLEEYDKTYLTVRCFKYFPVNDCLIRAASEGNYNIVKIAIGKGANYYNRAMAEAVKGGHIEIVKLMISLGANDYNYNNVAMTYAAKGGHIDIVKLMLDKPN